jgi:3-oxoacyl-[acyl-carrier-protein] synthase III
MVSNTHIRCRISGLGTEVPPKVVTNFDLEKTLDTTNQWIVERTGIHKRHISDITKDECTSDLAFAAAKKALAQAKMDINDIDLMIIATATPDYLLPSVSCMVHQKFAPRKTIPAFDLSAACSGFTYALHLGKALIKSSMHKNILIIGAEVLSQIMDMEDRSTAILFGDGAGAIVLSAVEESQQGQLSEASDILGSVIGAEGSGAAFFERPIGGTKNPTQPHHLEKRQQFANMQGREMFKVATRTLALQARTVCEQAGVSLSDVDWVIPHQANKRIIETTAEMLKCPMEKMIVNIDQFANTSSASIPLALNQAIQEGKIKRGQLLLFAAFGAGVTSGAVLIRY